MKIGIGGIHIESCTFSPLLSGEQDFSVSRGSDLLESYPFLEAYEDVSYIPLLYARALPGGPIERSFYLRFKDEFIQKLEENGPFDGLFMHMHGAMSVEGLEDAEGDFLSAVRKAAGKGCFIAASYDLHGNLSPRVMECIDFLSAYRTAPHIDVYDTLQRVYAMLMKCLRQGIRPHSCFIPVPVLFSGEKTGTQWEPAASLYQKIPQVITGEEVMDASVLIGYVWADEPRSTAGVVAFGTNQEKVRQAAVDLAQAFWDVRERFNFGVFSGSVDECIRQAVEASEQPVIISDSGDNPTAGGAGDSAFVLERMLAYPVTDGLVAGITDAEAVRQCEASGIGGTLELSLGGKLDPIHSRPLAIKAKVRSIHQPPWALNNRKDRAVLNPIAVIEVQNITVILTSRRTTFHRLIDFTNLGIDPHAYPIIVVKIGYLEPELEKLAQKALLALSPGAVNQDMGSVTYRKINHPMFPFDRDFRWLPQL